MSDRESLIELSQRAGFGNIHGLIGRSCGLIGSVMSDEYETIYIKLNSDMETGPANADGNLPVTNLGTVEVFGIGPHPQDYERCAMYRVERAHLMEWTGRGGVNIDKQSPLYAGLKAAGVMQTLASQATGSP